MARGRPTGWDLLRRKRLASDAHKKRLEYEREYRRAQPDYRARHARETRETREVLKANGLCVWCKKEAFKPFVLCPECLEKSALYGARYRRKKRRKEMIKTEFTARVREKAKLSTQAIAEDAVDAFLDVLRETLVEGGNVTFQGLGSFKVVARAERKGRNPRTGEELTIPARKEVKFTPAGALKEAVAG